MSAAAITPPYDIESVSIAAGDIAAATAVTTTATTTGTALTHKEGVKRLKKRYGLEEDSKSIIIFVESIYFCN